MRLLDILAVGWACRTITGQTLQFHTCKCWKGTSHICLSPNVILDLKSNQTQWTIALSEYYFSSVLRVFVLLTSKFSSLCTGHTMQTLLRLCTVTDVLNQSGHIEAVVYLWGATSFPVRERQFLTAVALYWFNLTSEVCLFGINCIDLFSLLHSIILQFL